MQIQQRPRIINFSFIMVGIIFLINSLALYLYDVENIGVLLQSILGIFLILFPGIHRQFLALPKYSKLKSIIGYSILIGAICFSSILIPMVYHGLPGEYVETDYLVILGARVKGEQITIPLKLRLQKGLDYLQHYPNVKAVVSGGQGPGESISEALAMQRYLIANGISADRIIMEDKSTSTFENFAFTRQKINETDSEEIKTVCIVTNDYHMYRSKMLAKRNRFKPVGIPCSSYWQSFISSYLRELLAFVKSFIFDR